jgi:hypothetical protein
MSRTNITTTPRQDKSATPLEFHPLADIFPLMEGEEFGALVADIKDHGLREPIVLASDPLVWDEDNGEEEGVEKILDGRNRYRACLAAGVEPNFANINHLLYGGGDADEREVATAFVISKNIHRRHLTSEQKRDLIAKVIAAKPEASDRQIAKQVKVNHKTVGAARAEMEATGEIPQLNKTVGADGKSRKRPAKKSDAAAAAARVKAAAKRVVVKNLEVEEAIREEDAKEAEAKAKATQLAVDLKTADRSLAERVLAYLSWEAGNPEDLEDALRAALCAQTAPGAAAAAGVAIEQPKPDTADTPQPKKRGRPKGRKNKPKLATATTDAPPQRGEDNAPSPEVGAEKMKAAFAAMEDDGLTLPGCLRRAS